jgi:hypothetical protein
VTHPLDPLKAGDIRRAAAIVHHDQGIGDSWRFASIQLKEPSDADLPALEDGRIARRDRLDEERRVLTCGSTYSAARAACRARYPGRRRQGSPPTEAATAHQPECP